MPARSVGLALLWLLGVAGCGDRGATTRGPEAGDGGPAIFVFAGGGDSINVFRADPARGAMTFDTVVAVGNDARLAEVDRLRGRVYVQTQIGRPLALLGFDVLGGSLTRSSELLLPSPNAEGVTQLIMHPTAPWLLVSITNASPGLEDHLLPVAADGSLGMARVISNDFYGFSWDPSGDYFYGLDGEAIFQYRFDPAAGGISPNDPPHAPGSAGRTVLALRNHPSGRFTYSVEERELGVYRFDAASGRLVADASTHLGNPVPSQSIYWTSLTLHPGGRFLYVLGYLEGSRTAFVDLFSIDETTGALSFVERQAGDDAHRVIYTGLQGLLVLPGPGGDHVLLGGHSTAPASWGKPVLVVYRVDPASGRLKAVGEPTALRPPETARVNFVFAL